MNVLLVVLSVCLIGQLTACPYLAKRKKNADKYPVEGHLRRLDYHASEGSQLEKTDGHRDHGGDGGGRGDDDCDCKRRRHRRRRRCHCDRPTMTPTLAVSDAPSTDPTMAPTAPTFAPTTASPTSAAPTFEPTSTKPTVLATDSPTTAQPTTLPTDSPTTAMPTVLTTESPTTAIPTMNPTTSAPTTDDVEITPGICAKTSGAAPIFSKENICIANANIAAAIQEDLPANELARSNWLGAAARLAFHDAGEFDINSADSLGPDGCLGDNADNAGLIEDDSLVMTAFEDIWQENCDLITRADFWVLFAKQLLEIAATTDPLSIPYQFGRSDATQCPADGVLPAATLGLGEIERVFVTQMGLTMDDAVALLGAHSLGHVHTDHSGFGDNEGVNPAANLNAWDDNPAVFDNEYYDNLLRPWSSEESAGSDNANPINHWVRGGQNPTIMLNVDMALAFPIQTGFTENQDCDNNPLECELSNGTILTGAPATLPLVQQFNGDNQAFMAAFSTAFVRMVSVGFGVDDIGGADGAVSTGGKLGSLTNIDFATCPAI